MKDHDDDRHHKDKHKAPLHHGTSLDNHHHDRDKSSSHLKDKNRNHISLDEHHPHSSYDLDKKNHKKDK